MQQENKIEKVGGFFNSLFNKIVNFIVFLIILALVGVIAWFWHETSLKKMEIKNLQKDIEQLKSDLQNEKNEELENVKNDSDSNKNPNPNSNLKNEKPCLMIGRICKDGKNATNKPNSCDLVCPEDEDSQNQNSNCAKEGENFSNVYKDKYKEKCCVGLMEWKSGMDTNISVADKCYETGMLAGSPVGTCINCGDGKCSANESICNCPNDCELENSKYKSIKEFCGSDEFARICKKNYVSKRAEELCGLCE